jgi:hypothetical protein
MRCAGRHGRPVTLRTSGGRGAPSAHEETIVPWERVVGRLGHQDFPALHGPSSSLSTVSAVIIDVTMSACSIGWAWQTSEQAAETACLMSKTLERVTASKGPGEVPEGFCAIGQRSQTCCRLRDR